MLILKNKAFYEWAIEQGVEDSMLVKAVKEIDQGLYEANLGGSIYKKRIPLAGRGKRGGARVILAFKLGEISVFIYGFSKNQKDNITDKEKEALKSLAKVYFAYSKEELKEAIKSRKFVEVLP